MAEFIGPAMPPHLQLSSVEAEQIIGPTLPLHNSSKSDDNSESTEESACSKNSSIGAILPEHLSTSHDKSDANQDSEEESAANMYGPALPPGLTARSSDRKLGPALPPQGFRPGGEKDDDSSGSDGEVVGPLPPSEGNSQVQEALERRAQALKRKFDSEANGSDQDGLKRESWMLELPPDRAKEFGLGPRQFRRREFQDAGDRSVWTDTPEDKANKKHSQTGNPEDEMQHIAVRARDTEMEKLVKKHGKVREKQKSLLEQHQEELKRKKQKSEDEGKPQERRPFDRNVDLQANRFDEAQKKSIFKKAQLLNDRFSRGESKYL